MGRNVDTTARYIFHIAERTHLEAAFSSQQATGEYRTSTRNHTLDDVGFIHGSDAKQVKVVANFVYRPDHENLELAVLVLDTNVLRDRGIKVLWEVVYGQSYPHIYGPISADCIVATIPAGFDESGSFQVPDLARWS